MLITSAEGRSWDESPTLRAVLRALVGIVPSNMFSTVPATQPVALLGLPAVVEAIGRRDGEAAERACASMFRAHGEAIVAHLAERGLIAASEAPSCDSAPPSSLSR